MPISLGFWRDAKREVACSRRSDSRARKKNSRTKKKKKRAEPERLEQAKREATGSNPGGTNTQGL